jgi:hypothetical protein
MIWFTNCTHKDEEGEGNMNLSKSRKVFPTGCRVVQALVPAKRSRQIISSLFVVLLLGWNAQAQTGDWQAVENLKLGTHVIVKAQHRYACSVEGTTEEQLVCEVRQPRSFRTTTLTIPRAEIHEVRTLPNQSKDAWIGAGIGAGAGAVTAASTSRTARGANAFFGALGGAGVGALVGGMVAVFQVIFQRGKLIYKG